MCNKEKKWDGRDDEDDDFDDLDENELEIEINIKSTHGKKEISMTTDVVVNMDEPGKAHHRVQGVVDFLLNSIPVAQLEMSGKELTLGKTGEITVIPKGPRKAKKRKRRKDKDNDGLQEHPTTS